MAALAVVTALLAGGAAQAASPSGRVDVVGRSGTAAVLTLPRTTIDTSLLQPAPGQRYVGVAVESLKQRRFVAVLARLENSIGVIGEGTESVNLPAGQYRLHLLGDGPRTSVALKLAGVSSQRVITTVPSKVTAKLTPLATLGTSTGTFTSRATLRPGGYAVLAYRLQTQLAPAGAIDLGFFDDVPATDPNGLFPRSGFRPLPSVSTFVGTEALVFATIDRPTGAAKTYREEVNVAAAATPHRYSEVLEILAG